MVYAGHAMGLERLSITLIGQETVAEPVKVQEDALVVTAEATTNK